VNNTGGDIDEKTLYECKRKNRKYQEQLYKQFYGFAMSIGLRYSNSRDEAKEIVNDSFIKVFSALEKYDSKQSFKAWIRRIIINTSIDHYRKEVKHSFHLDIEDPQVQDLNFEAIDQLSYDDIIQLLNDLPEIYRITFNLYEIEGFSHDEIADVLKITASSSRVYLMRAKKALRELFQKKFGEETYNSYSQGERLITGSKI
jgi:RNA polymerase sigma factor (sigma-70 family)